MRGVRSIPISNGAVCGPETIIMADAVYTTCSTSGGGAFQRSRRTLK